MSEMPTSAPTQTLRPPGPRCPFPSLPPASPTEPAPLLLLGSCPSQASLATPPPTKMAHLLLVGVCPCGAAGTVPVSAGPCPRLSTTKGVAATPCACPPLRSVASVVGSPCWLGQGTEGGQRVTEAPSRGAEPHTGQLYPEHSRPGAGLQDSKGGAAQGSDHVRPW